MSPQTLMLLAVAIPFVGVVVVLMSAGRPNQREAATLVTGIALFACVAMLAGTVLGGARPRAQLLALFPGVSFGFAAEPLGMVFALVASFLWIVNSIYSIGYMRANRERHQTRFYACFALAIGASIGIAFAANLLTLFLFYELLTLSTFPLVAHHGDAEALRGARVYLAVLMGTSIGFLLLAMAWIWAIAGTLEFTPGGILAGHIAGAPAAFLLVLCAYGVGKAALMPLHRWLPAAMVAPTPVSALLHAVAVVKAGVFTLTKILLYVFGTGFLRSTGAAWWVFVIAGFSIVAASVIALRQDNLKRRLAYSTVSQLGYVIMAASLLDPTAVAGAAMHIVTHAFGKITLFFAAGAIYTTAHKTRVSELDGIGRRMPLTMGAFAIGALSMIGMPLTAGFVSKWMILQGALSAGSVLAVAVLVASTLLNAAYYLPIVHAAFFRAPPESERVHGEAPWPILLALGLSAAGVVLLFFAPGPVLELARELGRGGR